MNSADNQTWAVCMVCKCPKATFSNQTGLSHNMYLSYNFVCQFKMAYADRADTDQTAPKGEVWSGSTLFAITPSNLYETNASAENIEAKVYNKVSEIFKTFTVLLVILDCWKRTWAHIPCHRVMFTWGIRSGWNLWQDMSAHNLCQE